jgi:Family of unknown function (DUF6292)
VDATNTPGSPQLEPWLSCLSGYVREACRALHESGLEVRHSWLDPYDPRDATILFKDHSALVFDEIAGWRYGQFLHGQPGVRTQLGDISYVGGGVLPHPDELVYRVINGECSARREYRSVTDLRDGFDDTLRSYGHSR